MTARAGTIQRASLRQLGAAAPIVDIGAAAEAARRKQHCDGWANGVSGVAALTVLTNASLAGARRNIADATDCLSPDS
jgi:hypothetical protein